MISERQRRYRDAINQLDAAATVLDNVIRRLKYIRAAPLGPQVEQLSSACNLLKEAIEHVRHLRTGEKPPRATE